MSKANKVTISELRQFIAPIAMKCNVAEGYFLRNKSLPKPERVIELVYTLGPEAAWEDFRIFEKTVYKMFPGEIVLTGVHSGNFMMQQAREEGKPLYKMEGTSGNYVGKEQVLSGA